jgi:hypothetical protein
VQADRGQAGDSDVGAVKARRGKHIFSGFVPEKDGGGMKSLGSERLTKLSHSRAEMSHDSMSANQLFCYDTDINNKGGHTLWQF